MSKYEYGTTEYYSEYFSDIIGDITNTEDIKENKKTIARIMDGFKQAVEGWLVYHTVATESHKELLDQFNQFEEETLKNQ